MTALALAVTLALPRPPSATAAEEAPAAPAAPATAAGLPDGAAGNGGVAGAPACLRAAGVEDGDRLTVDDPGTGPREIRLAGILAPTAADTTADTTAADTGADASGDGDSGDDDRAGGLAEAARRALADMVDGQCLVLAPAVPPTDRYGRLVATVRRDDGVPIQDPLVTGGLARVVLADVTDAGERRLHEGAVDALVAKYDQYRDRPPTGPAIVVEPVRWQWWSST